METQFLHLSPFVCDLHLSSDGGACSSKVSQHTVQVRNRLSHVDSCQGQNLPVNCLLSQARMHCYVELRF